MTLRPSGIDPRPNTAFPAVGARPAEPRRGPEDKRVRVLWPTTVFLLAVFAAFFIVGHAKNDLSASDPAPRVLRAR